MTEKQKYSIYVSLNQWIKEPKVDQEKCMDPWLVSQRSHLNRKQKQIKKEFLLM